MMKIAKICEKCPSKVASAHDNVFSHVLFFSVLQSILIQITAIFAERIN